VQHTPEHTIFSITFHLRPVRRSGPSSTGYIIPYIPDAKLGFVTDIWSPAPQIPPANPGTTALVKGVQKMGIQMDRMAGGHGGVGNFADLAKTVQ
jgi:hypothetical protein